MSSNTTELPALDRVVQADCIEQLRALPSASVHLIIADPPYNLNKDFGSWKEKERREQWLPWCREWLNECKRVLVPGGNLFVYGIHHHLCWIQCHLYEIGMDYRRMNGAWHQARRLMAEHDGIRESDDVVAMDDPSSPLEQWGSLQSKIRELERQIEKDRTDELMARVNGRDDTHIGPP